MELDLSFHGVVNYASEHTIYRIYFDNDRFAFIRKGRSEPYSGSGMTGRLLASAIRTAVHAAAGNGPGRSAGSDSDGLQKMLGEHHRNFIVAADQISDCRLTWDWLTRAMIRNPAKVVWHFSAPDRKPLKVHIWGANMKVGVPLLTGRFGTCIIHPRFEWNDEAERFERSEKAESNKKG